MYLKKSKNYKTGRTQLSAVQGYRENGKTKSKTIKTFGYLDILEKEYADPIAHFTEVVKQMDEERKADTSKTLITINPTECLTLNENSRKNFGYTAFSKIYHELEIQEFFRSRQRSAKVDYNLNSIFKLLVFTRLLNPASKRSSYEDFFRTFERTDFSLDDLYRSLDFFRKYQKDLQIWIHEHIQSSYGRDTSLVYYDVTNYYFESDKTDEMKMRGPSKENRKDPIIQMGLFMDTNGIPITYGLFPGNTLDKQTLQPMMENIAENYNIGRAIVVADRGMITGDNIANILSQGNGYILSYSIRGSDSEFKKYVLDESKYEKYDSGFKIKARIAPREIWITNQETGKKKKYAVDEKHVVFYSPEYAARTRHERETALEKAKKYISNPALYTSALNYGAAKYVDNITYDQETGEILPKEGKKLRLNRELIAEEERFDGYYAIVSSEHNMGKHQILDIYRGLWKIEESFKITKTDLRTRPVYLSNDDHIRAHFLICFVSLVIARLLEDRLEGKYSVTELLESLRKCECSKLEENIYLFNYYDDVLKDLGENLGIDYSKKYMRLNEIKKILAGTKTTT